MPGRDNGFVARHYLPLADLDPRLAEAMLDVLRAEGIAAYVEPSTGHLGGYLEVHLPERPRDRLWVDREHGDRAASLLQEHTAVAPTPPASEPAPSDTMHDTAHGSTRHEAAARAGDSAIDELWAELVASYDKTPDDAVPPWPVAEDIPGTPWPMSDPHMDGQQILPFDAGPVAPPDTAPPSSSPVPRRIVRPAERGSPPSMPARKPAQPSESPQPSPVESAFPSGEYDPLSILDEHFIPPTPPPPPALRPVTKWAILAIVGGFALILVKAFTDAVPGSIALGVLGIVGGFGTLVAGMRQDRADDSDSDDGAVV